VIVLINDTIDFDYTINQIVKTTEPTIYLQSNVLNSDYLNKSFEDIEKTLNILYEKTRYLEDAIAYTKEFLETRINDFHNDINSVLHEIENTADSAKNLSYISYNVPFVKNTKTISDRDGLSNIRPLIIRNDNLTLDYLTDKNQSFSMWSKISDSVSYKDNLKDVKTQPYRTIYLEEKLVPGGLTETIYVHFKEPTVINTLNIKPVNCYITNLKFGLINGIEENIGDYTIDMTISEKVCTYIKFDLVCTNYDSNTYTIDKTLITDNLWSKVQEFEYNQIANIETKFDASMILSKKVINSETNKKKTITYNSATYTGNESIIQAPLYSYEAVKSGGVVDIIEVAPDIPDVGEEKPTTLLKMYSYVFGIDEFEIKNSAFYTDGYMISDPITIGALKENEYIRLDVKHNKNDCAEISYSVLDGDREIPIAIMNEKWIENELIFGNTDSRFEMDFDSGMSYEKEMIKKNGALIDTSYVDAKIQALESNDRFSVTYKPSADFYDYKPINKTIRIKCYIRTFGQVKNIPYISSISIRKYGEESLWINRF
jgi:hypothetical protein